MIFRSPTLIVHLRTTMNFYLCHAHFFFFCRSITLLIAITLILMTDYGWLVARRLARSATSQLALIMQEPSISLKLFSKVAMQGLWEVSCLLQTVIAQLQKRASLAGPEAKMAAYVVGYLMNHWRQNDHGFQIPLSWGHTKPKANGIIRIDTILWTYIIWWKVCSMFYL